MTTKETGQYIRQVRKRLGMNQKQFAQALGISASMISKYETGLIKANDSILRKVKEVDGSGK